MMIKTFLVVAATTLCLTIPAATVVAADDSVQINDAYARASIASGAVFFEIENHQTGDDRLLTVATDAAERAELHTHKESSGGVMQMMELPEGIVVPGNGTHALARGGDHVMLLGLKAPLKSGDVVTLTLTFETAGAVVIEVPVDNERTGKATEGGMDHSGHIMPAPTN